MNINIIIQDALADNLLQALRRMTKPPRQLPDGSIVIEPIYATLEDYIADILANNFQQHLQGIPYPEAESIRAQIEELDRQMRQRFRPEVRAANTQKKNGNE